MKQKKLSVLLEAIRITAQADDVAGNVVRNAAYRMDPVEPVKSRKTPRKYTPEDPSSLKKPALLTNFSKWQGKKLNKLTAGASVAQPNMKGLESNLFAQILASPVRFDKHRHALLPAKSLLKFGIAEGPSSSEESSAIYVTPILDQKKIYKGSTGYVTLSIKCIQHLSQSKQWKRFAISIPASSIHEGLEQFNENIRWFPDTDKIIRAKMIEEILISHKLASVHRPVQNEPFYTLDWAPTGDNVNPFQVSSTQSLIVHVPLILESKISDQMFDMVREDYLQNRSLNIPEVHGRRLCLLLWKYYTFLNN